MTCNWKEAYGLLFPHKIKSKATRNLREKTPSWKFLGTPGAELFAALCRWCWLSINVNLITSRDVSRACFWDSFQRQLDLKALTYPMLNLPVNLNFEWTFGGDGTVEGGTYPKEARCWGCAFGLPLSCPFLLSSCHAMDSSALPCFSASDSHIHKETADHGFKLWAQINLLLQVVSVKNLSHRSRSY